MDRERRTLSLHILHVRDQDDVERARAAVLAEEERVVRAFGSADEIAALRPAGAPPAPREGDAVTAVFGPPTPCSAPARC